MRTALDSSVVILLQRPQPGWEKWREVLIAASAQGPLLISPVVFAECSAGYPTTEAALREFRLIQIDFDPLGPEAAHLAGQTFIRYRREGGPRQHLIPDFLVAAHAAVQADRLMAIDRSYLRRYFPNVLLLAPAG
ncbi:MAG: PIN domain-containing protein [Verrucomicrobiaceae bacterium]|nr:MAG: PIN domain-containing protein [Verrucomicrobiaceae bacterium]